MDIIFLLLHLHFTICEKELAKEIKKLLGDIDYEKYLMYLESMNVEKLEFLISEDLLVDIEHLL